MSMLLTVSAYSANPFLDSPDDKPVSAKFRGTEWGDNIDEGEIALTARAITTRVARMSWGSSFKIELSGYPGAESSRSWAIFKLDAEYL